VYIRPVQQYLTIWDLVLTPVYLLVLIAIAKKRRDKQYPVGHPLRKYYLPGLYAKFGGAIFIGLLYQYYYGGGDTFNFFTHARIINSALNDSFSTWLKLILHTPTDKAPEIYSYVSQMYWYNSPNDYAVGVITAIMGLFTFTTYLPTALLFAFFTFSGIWAMYTTFVQLYPKLSRPLAFAFLFIPSTVVWGSGIFKDTICMFGLGWMTYATFRLFINKDLSVKNFFFIAFSFYLVALVKLYILLAFLPALLLWLLLNYSRRIQTIATRWLVNLLFIGLTVASSIFFMQRYAEDLNKYSIEKLVRTAEVTRNWTNYAAGDEGSVYNIGNIDGTLSGMISLFPQAVVVTLFRPFPWEAKKIIIAFSALEALALLYFTLQLFTKRSKPLKLLVKDPNLLFCLVFVLIFAFAVGASSGNFGALSRYKIPCLPFFGALLAIMLGKEKTKTTRLTGRIPRQVYANI
jgi:hypothetical protein